MKHHFFPLPHPTARRRISVFQKTLVFLPPDPMRRSWMMNPWWEDHIFSFYITIPYTRTQSYDHGIYNYSVSIVVGLECIGV
jgi:hypothetical protein